MEKKEIRESQENAFKAVKDAFNEDQNIINGLETAIMTLQEKNAALVKKNKRLNTLLKETLDKITAWDAEDGDENENE